MTDLEKQAEFRLWLTRTCFDGQRQLALTSLQIAYCLIQEQEQWVFKAMMETNAEPCGKEACP